MSTRIVFILVSAVTLAVILAGVAVWQPWRDRAVATTSNTASGTADIGGPFQLTDQDGRAVTEALLQGQVNVIYFGYTYCPDVCPTTLQDVSTALDMMGDEADQVQPIFITVDPERDTVEVMKDYVKWFRPGMVGLTGTVDEVEAVKAAYKVYSAKAEQEGDTVGDAYLVDHTSITYVMGPDGLFLTHFSYGTSPEDMAATLKGLF